MGNILIVEDSGFFGLMITNKLKADTAFETTWVRNMTDARAALDDPGNRFLAAILDFNLPDAPYGEVIDEVTARHVPVIVFTSDLSEEVREFVWSKSVADYALKDDAQSLEYIVCMLRRIERNPGIKVLVVDDSTFFRKILTDLLTIHRYHVLNARNGVEALGIIDRHPDIQLVIADYSMPEMDGFVLTSKIRERYDKNEMAVIGISSQGRNILSARFIKNGANDFLIKQSFLTEEFYCRVTQNIQSLEHIRMVRDAAIKDHLTGLHNRRYFFDTGRKLFANAVREHLTITCAMVDIDHFKKVNDTYGHEVGDIALKHVAGLLQSRTRETDIVARMGGEEFCILAVNMGADSVRAIFDALREKVAASEVDIGNGRSLRLTISIGVVTALAGCLDEMVNGADRLLYEAKSAGRNKVIIGGPVP